MTCRCHASSGGVPLPRPGTPTTGALARPQHRGIRLFIDQGPASPAWRRVSSLRCGPRRRDRRVNCSIELAELVGQELPLVLKAAVAGVGGCQLGGDVKAGLVGGTGRGKVPRGLGEVAESFVVARTKTPDREAA